MPITTSNSTDFKLGFGKIHIQTQHGEMVFSARVDVQDEGYPIHWALVLPVKHTKQVVNQKALKQDDINYLVAGLDQHGFVQAEISEIKRIISQKAGSIFTDIANYRKNPPERLPKAKRW